MNRNVGQESAHLIKDLMVRLFELGFKGEFRELRKKIEEQLGHRVHSTFVFRPLLEMQTERIVHCSSLTGHWQAATVTCTWCGASRGKDQVDCWCGGGP